MRSLVECSGSVFLFWVFILITIKLFAAAKVALFLHSTKKWRSNNEKWRFLCKRWIVYLCSALPVVIEFLLLLVYLFSVINFYYFHSNNIVEYLVHNPIVAHSDSVLALTSQLLITVRSRIVGERIHRTLQCRIVWLRESLHKSRHSLLNQYGILPLRYHFLLYTVRLSRKKYQ